MKRFQENIKGNILELSISSHICDKGPCEEYISNFKDSFSNRTTAFTTLSIFLSLIIVLISSDIANIKWSLVLFGLLFIFFVRSFSSIIGEHVLYIPNVGLQQTTKYSCGLQSPHFIPSSSISDIIINEHVGWNHFFYLAVVLKNTDGPSKLCPLFQGTSPRLAFLQEVHNRILKLQEQQSSPS